MKRFLKASFLGLLLAVTAQQAAFALPLTQKPPTVISTFGNPAYYFDFSNNAYYGQTIWLGTEENLQYARSIFYAQSYNTSNTYYSLWKDGILRVSGPSALAFIPRITNYGLWIEGGPNLANNYLFCSRDLTSATCLNGTTSQYWTATNVTTTKTGVVGADATTGNATRLTATAAGGTVYQTVAFNGKLDLVNTSTLVGGGTGYAVNNTITLNDGCATHGVITVKSVSAGVITTTVPPVNSTAGSCGSTLPSNPVSQLSTSGSGTGATFNPFYRTGTLSCWMERVTGSGAVNLTTNGGTTLTNISSLLSTTHYTQVRTPTIQLANNTVGIEIATSGDVVNVDFCQLEDDDQATSPILTTTASTLRGPENVFIGTNSTEPNAGLQMISSTQAGTPVTYMYEYSGNFSTTLVHALMASDSPWNLSCNPGGGACFMTLTNGTTVSSTNDVTGLYTLNNISGNGAGVVNKVIFGVDGSGSEICVNGSAPTTSSVTMNTSFGAGSHSNPLNNGSNIEPSNGYLVKMAIWKRKLSPGECSGYSTVTNNQ